MNEEAYENLQRSVQKENFAAEKDFVNVKLGSDDEEDIYETFEYSNNV